MATKTRKIGFSISLSYVDIQEFKMVCLSRGVTMKERVKKLILIDIYREKKRSLKKYKNS